MRSFGGEGGRSSKDHIGSQGGGGGGQDGPKKDHIIFERSLTRKYFGSQKILAAIFF